MPNFAYSIRDATGAVFGGTSEAENEEILRRRLTEQGFTVVEIKQVKGGTKRIGGFGGVKKTELAVMCRQFSTMIDAGVNLVRCLTVLSEQSTSPKLRAILNDIRAEVESGSTLTRALEKYPNVFDRLFVGLVNAGEVGGALEESLQRLAGFLEKDVELRRKVKSAMTYPILVMCFAIAVVIGLMTFVLPKFMVLFEDLQIKELPAPTRMLKATSNFMVHKWYWMIVFVVGFLIAFRIFVRTRVGRRLYDRIKLKAPVLGKLNHKVALARFARTLSTLLSSGVGILQAMETVAGTVSNDIISDAILAARASIREGERIAEPLARSKLFPPMVVQMISIGEESGSLDPMLAKVADFYESEVEAALESLTSAIEPVLIVLLGVVAGFIVISIFLPLISVIQNLSSGGGGGT
ncbi:MAG: type II secretion system F family protein [Armatimonadota bacterium]|nr:type II secretion system F family protein [Armatimonadota bacterium]